MGFTEIYCYVDDFLKELDKKTGLITNNSNKTGCQSKLSRNENNSHRILAIIL